MLKETSRIYKWKETYTKDLLPWILDNNIETPGNLGTDKCVKRDVTYIYMKRDLYQRPTPLNLSSYLRTTGQFGHKPGHWESFSVYLRSVYVRLSEIEKEMNKKRDRESEREGDRVRAGEREQEGNKWGGKDREREEKREYVCSNEMCKNRKRHTHEQVNCHLSCGCFSRLYVDIFWMLSYDLRRLL